MGGEKKGDFILCGALLVGKEEEEGLRIKEREGS